MVNNAKKQHRAKPSSSNSSQKFSINVDDNSLWTKIGGIGSASSLSWVLRGRSGRKGIEIKSESHEAITASSLAE